MKKTIILSLLALCLLAMPGSAWELSFEEHPDDLSKSEYDTNIPLVSQDHGIVLKASSIDAITFSYIDIDKPFSGYLGMDFNQIMTYGTDGARIDIILTNETGTIYLNQVLTYNYISSTQTTPPQRFEFIESTSGNALEFYIDGIYQNSYVYTNPTAAESPSSIKIQFRSYSSTHKVTICLDNICSGYAMVGMDSEILTTDSYQYFTCSYPYPEEAYMFTRLYAPNGTIISTINLTEHIEYSFPKTIIQDSGTYYIRLFLHDNLGNQNYMMASRHFIFDKPSDAVISLDKNLYVPGDLMQIYTNIPDFTSGYTVAIAYRTVDGNTAYTYSVANQDYTKQWTIPQTALSGSFFAYLLNPLDSVEAYTEFDLSAPLGNLDLYLDKSTYENNDTVKITYKYLPEDSDITLILKSGSTNVYTTSYRDLSGSGVKTFDIGGRAADSIYIKVVNDNTILKDVSADILSGEYFLSGKIYDSSTNTVISGATIYIGGSETTSNALGYYEMTVLAGTQPVSIVKDGYNQYTGNVQVYTLSTTKNFYLVKTLSTGSNTLYGTVTDYYSGGPLTSAYIQIQNGSTIYSMLTNSKTGNYLFDQEGLEGSWTVTVTKTGYDSHQQIVTIDGDTYLSVKLVPVEGSASIPDDDSSSSSGSSSSDSSTERPGREAAKEAMDEFESLTPGLIGLVIIKVIRELVK